MGFKDSFELLFSKQNCVFLFTKFYDQNSLKSSRNMVDDKITWHRVQF